MSANDDAVVSTNDDATSCKHYAVKLGYWKDNYVQCFVRGSPERKAPEINRGYYVRVRAIRELVKRFLERTSCKCQIVNFGAGFDTLYWVLLEQKTIPEYGFYEVDMAQVTQRKCMAIKSRRELHAAFPEGGLVIDGPEAHSAFYHILPVDLRSVSDLDSKLSTAGLDKSKPTLFITECVLVYLQPSECQRLFAYITSRFDAAMIADYDPVNLSDKFGQVMIQNLRGRQCALLGASPNINSKIDAFIQGGFEAVHLKLVYDIYVELPIEERRKIESLEFLDEVDLLFDLLKHYAVSCAFVDKFKSGLQAITLTHL